VYEVGNKDKIKSIRVVEPHKKKNKKKKTAACKLQQISEHGNYQTRCRNTAVQ
jgi:hypothetical protein